MVGLFDSGAGGLNTVRYIKNMTDDVDLVYLIDRENAPYGTKSKKQIINIVSKNIDTLADMGAKRILLACCTASTVYPYLSIERKKMSIPIIDTVAKEAKNATRSGRITVIATNRTVRSHAFKRALKGYKVSEIALGELVNMIDSGLCDSTITKSYKETLEKLLLPVKSTQADTLILGCTHFPALKKTISEILCESGINNIIDSALIGAESLINASKV